MNLLIYRKVIVVLSMKIIKPASEIPGKIGQPVQLSDQITVIEEMAKEMKMQSKSSFLFVILCLVLLL